MNRTLIFISERYPFDFIGGTYEQNEVLNLKDTFDTIIVFTEVSTGKIDTNYILPANVKPYSIKKLGTIEKLLAIRFLFSKYFFYEVKNVIKQHRFNFNILKIALIELAKSVKLKKQITSYIKKNKVDTSKIVVYSYWNDYRAFASSMLKSNFPQIKVVSRGHAADIIYERHPYNYMPFKQKMIELIDAVYPISKGGKSYLVQKIGFPEKFKVFYLGVENKKGVRLITQSDKIRVVSCSHIVPIKRVELIAKYIANIKLQQTIEWIHIGGDYTINKNFQQTCELLFNNSNNTFKLLGSFTNTEIMNYYAHTDVDLFINLSIDEGIPVSIMEAISYGTPTIATNVGGIKEIVVEDISGWLVSPNPLEIEIKNVINLYSKLSIEDKNDFRQKTHAFWKENFNAEKNYGEFVKMIQSL